MRELYTLIFTVLLISSAFAQWEIRSSFSESNIHHAVGFSYGDKGYLVTGSEDTSTTFASKVFLEYNSLTDSWSRKDDFPGPARSYAIGDFYNGKMYLGFGSGSLDEGLLPLNDLWSYDPESGIWEELKECPCPGRQHPSFNILDDKIYVGLGDGLSGDLQDFWEYDITENLWTQKSDFPAGKRHHPFHFVLEDQVYVGFGHDHAGHHVANDMYRYSPDTDTWTRISDIPSQGRVAGTQFDYNGFGYVLSGMGEDLTNGFHHSMEEGEFWRYDKDRDEWFQLTSHPGKSRFAPASFVIDDFVYLISGIYPTTGNQSQVMRYDLSKDLSSSKESYKNLNISVYPNPFTDCLTIETIDGVIDRAKLSIYNLFYQKIFDLDIQEKTVDLSFLPAGIYWLEIRKNQQSYQQRIIKVPGK